MWVPTEARYDVAGGLGLRNLELGPRPAWGRRVGRFLLGVPDTGLLEREVLRRGAPVLARPHRTGSVGRCGLPDPSIGCLYVAGVISGVAYPYRGRPAVR